MSNFLEILVQRAMMSQLRRHEKKVQLKLSKAKINKKYHDLTNKSNKNYPDHL